MYFLNECGEKMKTNQVMSVAFEHGFVSIEHKTAMGNLADVFAIGNKHRILAGKSPANITHFTNSEATKEFVRSVARRLSVEPSSLMYTIGRGKTARVVANLFILIYAAEYLSSDFHVEVIDTFINSKILTWRDESGDAFKGLNEQLKDCAEKVLGKPAHQGHFITLAKIINARVGNAVSVDWNMATAEQLSERTRLEGVLTAFIRMGVVKDWEHLKQIAAEV